VNEESEVHKCIEAGAGFAMSDKPQLVFPYYVKSSSDSRCCE